MVFVIRHMNAKPVPYIDNVYAWIRQNRRNKVWMSNCTTKVHWKTMLMRSTAFESIFSWDISHPCLKSIWIFRLHSNWELTFSLSYMYMANQKVKSRLYPVPGGSIIANNPTARIISQNTQKSRLNHVNACTKELCRKLDHCNWLSGRCIIS